MRIRVVDQDHIPWDKRFSRRELHLERALGLIDQIAGAGL